MRTLIIALLLALAGTAHAQGTILGVYNNLSRIDVINPASGASVSQTALTSSQTIFGFTGLAQDPTTGTLYAAVRTTATAQDIFLGTVNRTAGTVTLIGEFNVAGTGESIANIQFDSTGQLWAISGIATSGTPNPERLFACSKATAALTSLVALGNGQNSEALGFDPTNAAVVYHYTGTTSKVFETVNLTTGATGAITLTTSPPGTQTILCMAYDSNSGRFWTCTNSNVFGHLTPAGTYTQVGTAAGAIKGMVVLPTAASSVNNLNLGTTPQGTAGTPQSFNLTGFNLFGDVTVTAPAGVEVSLSMASGYATAINVPRSGVSGQLNSTQVFVRIAASAPAGNITADLSLSALGGNTATVALTGTVSGREMDVFRGVTAVTAGSTDNVGSRETGQAFTLTYDIDNVGTLALTLTVPVTPANLVNCNVTVTTQPAASVAGSGTTQLVLSVTPPADGAFSFDISIANDDPDENPYDIAVSGTASTTPVLDGPGGDGGGDGGCSSGESHTWLLLAALLIVSGLVARRVGARG